MNLKKRGKICSQELLTFLTSLKQKHFCVGFSGGVDSSVLLHQVIQLRPALTSLGIRLSAVYVNHHLSPLSTQWAAFCQSQCLLYELPFQTLSVDAQAAHRQSPEAAAREARYLAFNDILGEKSCLLTAHHLDDQAETLMLQLFRGAGVSGLSAMPMLKKHLNYSLARPLLQYSKQAILAYADMHQLQWIEDESNQQPRYRRNFLRLEIFPKLKQMWPQVDQTLLRVSQQQAEAAQLLQEIAEDDLRQASVDPQQISPYMQYPLLNLSYVQHLSIPRCKNLIQYWLKKQNFPCLSSKLLSQLMQNIHRVAVFAANNNKNLLRWKLSQQQFELHAYRNFLCVFVTPKNIQLQEKVWDLRQQEKLDLAYGSLSVQFLTYNQSQSSGFLLAEKKLSNGVIIRYRSGKERFKKSQQSQHFSLKNWFQEQGIPMWYRDKLPLIYINGELVQIANHLLNQDYLAKQSEPAVMINFLNELNTPNVHAD